MKASVYHIQLNVSDKNKSFKFYNDLLGYLEYTKIFNDDKVLGMTNKTTDLWLVQTRASYKKSGFHRKNTGINHLAFKVKSKTDVDKFCEEFLKPRKIKTLYNSPKAFPEYTDKYYAVFFEDPDRIKLEVCYL